MFKILHLFLIILILSEHVKSRSVVIEFDTFRHEFNSDILTMTTKLINDGTRNVINGSIFVVDDIQHFDLISTLTVPGNNGGRITLFNTTTKGCDVIEEKFANFMTLPLLVMKAYRKHVKNLPSKCPLKKDTELIVSNVYMDTEQMPIYLPHVRFQFTLAAKNQTHFGFKVYVEGSTFEKRAKLRKGKRVSPTRKFQQDEKMA